VEDLHSDLASTTYYPMALDKPFYLFQGCTSLLIMDKIIPVLPGFDGKKKL
jgi:hypothetical protein